MFKQPLFTFENKSKKVLNNIFVLNTLMSSINLSLLYTVPISAPRILSRTIEMGKDRGEVTNIKNFVNQIVFAPTASPCREQTACGMISPNMTIPRVAPMTATTPPPPVRVSRRTVRVLLTRTLPRRIEQSRKFPIPRIGMIAYAHIYYQHIQS